MNRKLIGELNAWGGVAVIGAGASVSAGMPLAPQLPPLVWHALDRAAEARSWTAKQLGLHDRPSQHLVGDTPGALRVAYRAIAAYPEARHAFQQAFAARDRETRDKPSPAHDALAGMLHRGILKAAVSLNWDTLIEAAYARLYGARPSTASMGLFKPHGDAALPGTDWVLPDEPGFLSDELLQRLSSIVAERPHVLMIVGYSERDETVVQKLIAPMADRWRVARIGPGAKGALDLDSEAAPALTGLLDSLAPGPELPGWHYVTFGRQRDLSFSLAGEKLGAADVVACPPLREVEAAQNQLEAAGIVALHGGSGEGKSITAYQVAHHFSRQGWDVVSSDHPEALDSRNVQSLNGLRHRTLILLDDAQTISRSVLTSIRDRVSKDFKLLATSTEASNLPVGVAIRVDPARAVRTLQDAFLNREREILPIVSKFDPWIGESYLSEPLGDRVRHAAASSLSPWQFSFVLTGGWRRCSAAVRESRDEERSDLILGTIAALQLLTLDSGVSRAVLDEHSRKLGLGGVSGALDNLARLRLVVEQEGRIRCLHARLAIVVLGALLRNLDEQDGRLFVSALREIVLGQAISLAGANWLLDRLWFDNSQHLLHRYGLLADGLIAALTERCFAAGRGRGENDRIGSAATLLQTLTYWDGDTAWRLIEEQAELLQDWYADCQAIDAYGLARLLNTSLNTNREFCKQLGRELDLDRLAKTLNRSNAQELARLADLIERLGQVLDDERKAYFLSVLDFPSIQLTISDLSASFDDVWRLSKIATSFIAFDWGVCFDLLYVGADKIAEAMNEDVVEAYVVFEEASFQVLIDGEAASARKRGKSGRAILKKIASQLDPLKVSKRISHSSLRDGENCARFLFDMSEADPKSTRRIIEKVDLEVLDETFKGLWRDPPRELYILLQGLARTTSDVARRWLQRHEAELEVVHRRLVLVDSAVCARVLRRGGRLNFEISANLGWDTGIETLRQLIIVDPEAARAGLRSDMTNLAEAMALKQGNAREDGAVFVRMWADLDPALLAETIAKIDPFDAAKHWPQHIRGTKPDQALVRLLADKAAAGEGEIAKIARGLISRRRSRSSRPLLRPQQLQNAEDP